MMGQQAIAGDRNPYYEGQFGAESPEDTAACPALVADRDALQKKVAALRDVVHKECDFGRDTGISFEDFVNALYEAGWRSTCDAQHTEIEKRAEKQKQKGLENETSRSLEQP